MLFSYQRFERFCDMKKIWNLQYGMREF